jgi:hypothetical protein
MIASTDGKYAVVNKAKTLAKKPGQHKRARTERTSKRKWTFNWMTLYIHVIFSYYLFKVYINLIYVCKIKYIINYIDIVFAFSANREVFGGPVRGQICKQFHYYKTHRTDLYSIHF